MLFRSTVQSEIASNLTTAETYTDTANTKLKAYVDNNYFPSSGGSITGITSITNTTDSTSISSGALTVAGGVGITKNLNVGGNATITGSLTVLGTQIITNTSTVNYNNPYISLHAPTSGYLVSNDGTDIGVD